MYAALYAARVEIDGLTRESYRELCLRWVREILPARSPDAWARILAGEPALYGGAGGVGEDWPPWGEPGGLFGDWVILRHRDARDVDLNDEGSPGHFVQSRKKVSLRTFERDLPIQLADPAPHHFIDLAVLDEQGFPVGGLGGAHHLGMEVVGWGHEPVLVLTVSLDDPLSCSDMSVNLDVTAAVRRFVQSVDVAFGHIGRSSNDQTEIERCFSWQTFTSDPFNRSAGSRRILRGYSWVTIVAKDLAPKLSPVSGITVEALPSGAVWLQAGPNPAQYDAARVEAMWRSVAGALPPGEPINSEMARLEHQRSTGVNVPALHVELATLHETIMRPASDAGDCSPADES